MSEDEDEAHPDNSQVKDLKPVSRTQAKSRKQKKTKTSKKGKEDAAPSADIDIDAALKDLGLDPTAHPSPQPPQTNEVDEPFSLSVNVKLLSPDEGTFLVLSLAGSSFAPLSHNCTSRQPSCIQPRPVQS